MVEKQLLLVRSARTLWGLLMIYVQVRDDLARTMKALIEERNHKYYKVWIVIKLTRIIIWYLVMLWSLVDSKTWS